MIVRKPSSSFTISSASSAKSSHKTPSASTEDCDADDEDAMSAEGFVPSRPLSVAIPPGHGAFSPRRPNLREILANTSSPPWTLAAFMAYLSNNHCLETLEFTMDAGRYKKHFAKMMSRSVEGGIPPAKDCEYVQALWQRLVEAYIQPSGSREVNLPSDVRDPILSVRSSAIPPSPELLGPAVAKIYELMEESVLVPFLNSVYPQSAAPTVSSCPQDMYRDAVSHQSRAYDERSAYSRRTRNPRAPPLLQHTSAEQHAHSFSPHSPFRKSAPITLSASPPSSRPSTKLAPSTSSPVAPASYRESDGTISGSVGMTDDSGSTGSPTMESPRTPPISPPVSDMYDPRRDSGMWKRLGRFGASKMHKKKSHGMMTTNSE